MAIKYSKHQILEAISKWEKQLNEMEAQQKLEEASAGVVAGYLRKHLVPGKNVIEWRDQMEKWYSDKTNVKDLVVGDDEHGQAKDFGSVKMDLHVVSYADDSIKYPDRIVWPRYNTLKISDGAFSLMDFTQAVKYAVKYGMPRMDKIVGYGPAGVDRTADRCSSIIDTLNGKKAWFKLDQKSMYDKYRHRRAGGYHATAAADLSAAEKFLDGMLRGKEITIDSGARIIDTLSRILEKSEDAKAKEKTDDAKRNISAQVPKDVVIPDYEAPAEKIDEIIDLAAKFYGYPSLYDQTVPDEYEEVEGAQRDLDDWDIYRINRQETISEEDFYERVAEEMFDKWEPGETVQTKDFAPVVYGIAEEISETALEEYQPDEDQLIHRGVYKSEAYWRS